TIYELAADGKPVDIGTVADRLRQREQLGAVGGPAYLAQLTDATPAHQHVEAHALCVVEWWIQREAGKLGHTLAAEHYGDVGDRRLWIARAMAKLAELAEHGRTHTEEHIRPVLAR